MAVITGAASGIGRATASIFAKKGHPLLLVDLDEKHLEQVVAELEEEQVAYSSFFLGAFRRSCHKQGYMVHLGVQAKKQPEQATSFAPIHVA